MRFLTRKHSTGGLPRTGQCQARRIATCIVSHSDVHHGVRLVRYIPGTLSRSPSRQTHPINDIRCTRFMERCKYSIGQLPQLDRIFSPRSSSLDPQQRPYANDNDSKHIISPILCTACFKRLLSFQSNGSCSEPSPSSAAMPPPIAPHLIALSPV